MKQRLTLKHQWAFGDTVILSALLRDIHLAYPGRFETDVVTPFKTLWGANPHVTRFSESGGPAPLLVDVSYKEGIEESRAGRVVHMLAWYHEDFRRKTGLAVPVTKAGADLHLGAAEAEPLVRGRYWVVVPGGKLDMTTKMWAPERYQEVVDRLAPYGVRFVRAGATHRYHVQPPLRGTLDAVGRTEDLRDFLSLVRHADGVLCGVTGAMHVAAAFERPCVVVAGAREEPHWEAYTGAFGAFGGVAPRVPHRYLHTVGRLHCAKALGCWNRWTVPYAPSHLRVPRERAKLCREPVRREGAAPTPLCMDMISVDHVIEAVLSYYADGTLPPLR